MGFCIWGLGFGLRVSVAVGVGFQGLGSIFLWGLGLRDSGFRASVAEGGLGFRCNVGAE